MVVAKAKPTTWSQATILLRFVEQNGISTSFFVSGDALPQFEVLEKWRIYELTIPGACVKSSNGTNRYGVINSIEVRLKYPCKLELSKKAWPFIFPYRFIDWNGLNQASDNQFIDIIGRIATPPNRDTNAPFPKMIVELTNEDYIQSVEILGNHTASEIHVGDVVAFAGVRVKEWRNDRTLETSYLTLIEINPTRRQGIPEINTQAEGEPKRKAMKMSFQTPITVAEIVRQTQVLVNDAERRVAEIARRSQVVVDDAKRREDNSVIEFNSIARFAEIDETFFDADPPVLGEGAQAKMSWKTRISDPTGDTQVKVWDKACFTLFQITAAKMRTLWETGVENTEERETILATLNANLQKEFRLSCTARVWSYGFKNVKHELQINVNLVEVNTP